MQELPEFSRDNGVRECHTALPSAWFGGQCIAIVGHSVSAALRACPAYLASLPLSVLLQPLPSPSPPCPLSSSLCGTSLVIYLLSGSPDLPSAVRRPSWEPSASAVWRKVVSHTGHSMVASSVSCRPSTEALTSAATTAFCDAFFSFLVYYVGSSECPFNMLAAAQALDAYQFVARP
ncbi:hypothetical protein BXZ70DRAFT_1003578 [Cristinia sonorae]|uniref:Uncharacterized protein n=1 Tax=Cristinia sonorae TaxID=1940300 RepID=A0A8K0XUY7_9AGAR|nr:hypothetical protein BXZ70DRAFT_1003578 [Cristinia sonorae]